MDDLKQPTDKPRESRLNTLCQMPLFSFTGRPCRCCKNQCLSTANCNLCLLICFFFFFSKPCRSGFVLYKSLLLGPVIQKFCRSSPVSCKFEFFFFFFGMQICVFWLFAYLIFFFGCKSVFFFIANLSLGGLIHGCVSH